MTNPPIVLYSLRECPHCEAARRFLEARGVTFVERDVREEPRAIQDLAKTTGESFVPTIVYGDDVQIGWDPVRAAEMLDDPLPPEEDDHLLAVIEAATAPDSDWPAPSSDELAPTPPTNDVSPLAEGAPPSAFPREPLTSVPTSSGTAVVSAEVPAGLPRNAAGCTSPAE